MHTTPTVSPAPTRRPAAGRQRRPDRRPLARAIAAAVEGLEVRRLYAVTGLNNGTWTSAGPTDLVDSSLPGTQAITGTLTGVATDPVNPDVYYVASAGGGIWKTTDGGTTYAAQIDSQPALNIGAIAIAPSNASVVYAGTGVGDSDVDSTYGQGIYRTLNAGATWTLLATQQFARQAVEKIAVDPADSGTVYAAVNDGQAYGVVAGVGTTGSGTAASHPTGIYKSTDGGVTWTDTTAGFTTDDYFYDIEIDPTTPTTIYATTQSLVNGQSGIYKTNDGGLTWNPTGAFPTPTLSSSNRPLGGNQPDGEVFNFTTGTPTPGVSLGGDLTQNTSVIFGRTSIAIAPNKPGTIYAAISSNTTTDSESNLGDTTFGPDGFFNPITKRYVDLDPGYLLVSTDGGATWAQVNNVPLYSQQAEFDNSVIVDRANPSTFYLGGSTTGVDPTTGDLNGEVFRGNFSGQTFTDLTVGTAGDNGVGDDVRQFAYDADNRLLAVTDEGIFRLDDPTAATVAWTNLNGNIGALRARSIALSPSTGDAIVAAAEYNGVVARAGTGASTAAWAQLDAFENVRDVVVDPTNPSTIYFDSEDTSITDTTDPTDPYFDVSNYVMKSTDGGATFNPATRGIPVPNLPDNPVNAYHVLAMDPDDPNRLLLGSGTHLYESLDGAATWTLVNTFAADITTIGVGNHGISSGEPTTTDTRHLYVGTVGGAVFESVTNSVVQLDAGNQPLASTEGVFTEIDVPTTTTAAALATAAATNTFGAATTTSTAPDVERLVVDSLNSSTVFAVVGGFASAGTTGNTAATGGHVFESTDAGTTWTDISGNLPNVPVHDLVDLPTGLNTFTQTLYAATDRGVYVTYNLGQTWAPAGVGLPDAAVDSLAVDTATGVLAAATDGRGVWELSTVYPASTVAARVFDDVNATGASDPSEQGIAGVTVQLYSPGLDGVVGDADDAIAETRTTDADGNYSFTDVAPGNYYLHFVAPAGYFYGPAFSGTATAAVPEDTSAGLVGYDPAATGGSAVSPASGGNTAVFAVADAGTVSPTQVTTLQAGLYQRTVIVTNPQVVRSATAATAATFTVTISPANDASTEVVTYATADGTALAGTDYTATAGTLTFAPGVTSQTVTVPVLASAAVQVNKTFDLDVTAPADFVTPDAVNPALIINDNFPVASIAAAASVTRDATSDQQVSIPVTLSVPAPFDTSVVVTTSGGTAASPTDFDAASYTLYFPAGTTTETAVFTALPGTDVQVDRTFSVTLSDPVGATISPTADASTVTIVANTPPTVSVADASVAPNAAGGVNNLAFTVSLSAPVAQAVTVSYTTGDGTAVAGTDYRAVSGTLTFAPGEVSQTVNVPVIEQFLSPQTVTLGLAVSNPTGGVAIGTPTGIGTIVDPGTTAVGTGSTGQYAYTDGLGQKVSVALRGPGTAQIVFVGGASSGANAAALVLDGTTAASSLTIHVTAAAGHRKVAGQTSFQSIQVNGSLGTFNGRGVNLTGVFTATGSVNNLILGFVSATTITIGGTAGSVGLTFTRVVDTSITSAIAIRSLKAGAYLNTDGVPDLVTAPVIGPIRVAQGAFGGTLVQTAVAAVKVHHRL